MSLPRIRCPHCARIDWDKAPELFQTLTFAAGKKTTTSREIADQLDLTIANASNRLRTLIDMGFVSVRRESAQGGGIRQVATITALGREALT